MGVSLREAATRVFSNASGSYSSNVNLAVENSSWSDESQLQEMYLARKSFAFNSDRPGAGGEANREVRAYPIFHADQSRGVQLQSKVCNALLSVPTRQSRWDRTSCVLALQVFVAAMKTVDVTFQNLDSSEISLTDVSHYFDSDPTKLVKGLRTDGNAPAAFIADTTTANAQVGLDWITLKCPD